MLYKSVFSGMLGGMMICIGGTVMLAVSNPYLGAFMFPLGLFVIITHKYGLFTGMVCEVPNKPAKYLIELFLTLFGNFIGVLVFAILIFNTRISVNLTAKATTVMAMKLNDSFLSAFVLGVLCGIMIYLAKYTNNICKEEKNSFGGTISVFLCIAIFIIAGFNHCIADMYYFFLTMGQPRTGLNVAAYFTAVISGNAVGGMFIPLLKKLKFV